MRQKDYSKLPKGNHIISFSDKPVGENKKVFIWGDRSGSSNSLLTVSDEGRIAEIHFKTNDYLHSPQIVKIVVDEKEYKIFSSDPDRLVEIFESGQYSNFEVRIRTEKWSVVCNSSDITEDSIDVKSYLYYNAKSINASDFIDVLVEKKSLDAFMNERHLKIIQKEAEWAQKSRKALKEIGEINEAGGAGSRKKVRQIVDSL